MSIHHHDYFMVNVPVAVFFGSVQFWISALSGYGEVMIHFVVPTLSAVVLASQLWLFWYKYWRH
jgi:hypothetical protein